MPNSEALSYRPPSLLYLRVEQGWHAEATAGGLRPSGFSRVYTIDVRNRDMEGNGGDAHNELVARKYCLAKGFLVPAGFLPRIIIRDKKKDLTVLEHPSVGNSNRRRHLRTSTPWQDREPSAAYSTDEINGLSAMYDVEIKNSEGILPNGYTGFPGDEDNIDEEYDASGKNYFDPKPDDKKGLPVPEAKQGGIWSFFSGYEAGLVKVEDNLTALDGITLVGERLSGSGSGNDRYVIRMNSKLVRAISVTLLLLLRFQRFPHSLYFFIHHFCSSRLRDGLLSLGTPTFASLDCFSGSLGCRILRRKAPTA